MLVASDELTDKDYPAISKVKGDIFMIVGATLYGFSTFKFVPLLTISSEPSQSSTGTFFYCFFVQQMRRKSSSSEDRRFMRCA